jgi:hypothetical protein
VIVQAGGSNTSRPSYLLILDEAPRDLHALDTWHWSMDGHQLFLPNGDSDPARDFASPLPYTFVHRLKHVDILNGFGSSRI